MISVMLYRSIYILAAICLLPTLLMAQAKPATAKIAAIARYKDQKVELRWIPDNKTILRLGFTNSYTIQRKTANEDFRDIATIKALDSKSWEQLIATEKDTAVSNTLDIAREFLFAGSMADDKGLDLEKGTIALREQKAKEDMVYALFVLSVMKSGKTAEALGLAYTDASVTPGATYTYRVRLNASSPVYQTENGLVEIKAAAGLNELNTKISVYPGDKTLSFTWPANKRVNGYWVERSIGNATSYSLLNTVPFYHTASAEAGDTVNGSFGDDSLKNYTWYYYRFYGMTAFGDRVLLGEAKGMPRDLTPPPAPVVKQPTHTKPREVLVEWQLTAEVPDLKGFVVGRSTRDTGKFQVLHKELLSPKTKSFTDTTFSTSSNNYYTVYALDTAGNISASYAAYVALVDSVAPAAPSVLRAVIDSTGIVRITVKKGTEDDLKGYRLFKSNDKGHELSVIEEAFRNDKADTTALKLLFTDTIPLNSLTPNVYYKLKALDFNYNQSAFSAMIVLKRPDTIPPTAPVFTDVTVGEKKITLFFAGSESADLDQHILCRKSELSAAWTSLVVLPRNAQQYTDTSVQAGKTYYYSLRAKDSSGLFSAFINPVYGKPYPDDRLPVVTQLRTGLREKQVLLQWQYPKQEKTVVFVIYKKRKDAALVQYARVNTMEFTDTVVDNENTYAIKVLATDGSQSALSPLITQRKE
jgi:fibronectin type 3 domain-containing protein